MVSLSKLCQSAVGQKKNVTFVDLIDGTEKNDFQNVKSTFFKGERQKIGDASLVKKAVDAVECTMKQFECHLAVAFRFTSRMFICR